jgi:hypothetical protein
VEQACRKKTKPAVIAEMARISALLDHPIEPSDRPFRPHTDFLPK